MVRPSRYCCLLKHEKELRMQRDYYRWSSLCSMLERYDRVTDALHGILDDLELGNLKLESVTEFLCKRDSMLAQAEVII